MPKISRNFYRIWQYRIVDPILHGDARAGKITVAATLVASIITTVTLGAFFEIGIPFANASNVSTSVTVLNTPPSWTVDPAESPASATTTPTNAGSTLTFTATATDSSSDNYWLLVCSASSTPTAHSNAAPTCGSGIQWAVSGSTVSGQQATAATTTIATAPFNNESNNWFAYICDGNSSGALCNAVMKQGTGNSGSPFVIDHPPIFSAIVNTSPQNPGGTITWTATATDTDVIRGGDTIKLLVCKAADYANGACGAGGTWASSTYSHFNPATSTVLSIPFQDKTYNAFVYVTDQNNLDATSTFQGSNSSFVVNNVAPSVSAATISVGTTSGNIILTNPHASNGPYTIKFTVTDNNGCQNASGTQEVVSATSSTFRSGVGAAACQLSTDYNTNSCYPSANPQSNFSCSQDAGSCSGPNSTNSTWTCTYNLWYNADPTDAGSQFSGQNWLANVQVTDDNGAVSSATTSSTGNTLTSLLAFNVSTSSIGYGGLQPGQQTDPLPGSATTDLQEWGNVGLDENLYGDTMCTTWSAPDSCDVGGADPTKKIPVNNQKFASSSVSYASATILTSSTTPSTFLLHVPKTIATSSAQTKNTFWGIGVPASITVSGSYSGQNTITAVKSNSAFW